MKRVIVAGSSGQLGQCLLDIFSEVSNIEVVATNSSTLDITNEAQVVDTLSSGSFSYFINCAAYCLVDKAQEEEAEAYRVNAEAPGLIAKHCSELRVKLIHVSTDYVFSGKGYLPYVETDAPAPLSVYGESKLAGERVVLEASSENIVLRTSWLYSEYGNNFFKTILRLAQQRPELSIVADQIGSPTYARTLARIIFQLVMEKDCPEAKGLYHCSNEGVASWYDFARSIVELSSSDCRVLPIPSSEYPTPAQRPFYSLLNKAKLKKDLGIQIPHWQVALGECFDRFKYLNQVKVVDRKIA